jgi:hypothetical protein
MVQALDEEGCMTMAKKIEVLELLGEWADWRLATCVS